MNFYMWACGLLLFKWTGVFKSWLGCFSIGI